MIRSYSSAQDSKQASLQQALVCVFARSFPKAVSGLGASEGRCSGRVRLFQMEARQKEGLHLAGLDIVRVDTSGGCCLLSALGHN